MITPLSLVIICHCTNLKQYYWLDSPSPFSSIPLIYTFLTALFLPYPDFYVSANAQLPIFSFQSIIFENIWIIWIFYIIGFQNYAFSQIHGTLNTTIPLQTSIYTGLPSKLLLKKSFTSFKFENLFRHPPLWAYN